jgi:hypothetical protein
MGPWSFPRRSYLDGLVSNNKQSIEVHFRGISIGLVFRMVVHRRRGRASYALDPPKSRVQPHLAPADTGLPQTLGESTMVALENNSIADVVLFALIFTVTSSVKFLGR